MKHMLKVCFVVLALLVCAGAGAEDKRDQKMLDAWISERHQEEVVDEYQQFLKSKGVDDVIPIYQLLRTSTDWDTPTCKNIKPKRPFSVPAKSDWGHIATTLKMLRILRNGDLLPEGEVVSSYRDRQINTCSKGGATSEHLGNFAVDYIPKNQSVMDTMKQLCTFYHHSPLADKYQLGLGLYKNADRIHIDTLTIKGKRPWGPDTHGKTSPCNTKFTKKATMAAAEAMNEKIKD